MYVYQSLDIDSTLLNATSCFSNKHVLVPFAVLRFFFFVKHNPLFHFSDVMRALVSYQ